LRRTKVFIDSNNTLNPRKVDGIFTIGEHPENDGKVGGSTFQRLWTAIADIDTLTDDLPPQTIMPHFYFHETMPFFWSK